jgi:hypothetical protein
MRSLHIEGANTLWGAPGDWKPENPPCADLWARAETADGLPMLVTAWEPTPDDVAAIAAGAPIYLTIVGTVHPPVAVEVGPIPET